MMDFKRRPSVPSVETVIRCISTFIGQSSRISRSSRIFTINSIDLIQLKVPPRYQDYVKGRDSQYAKVIINLYSGKAVNLQCVLKKKLISELLDLALITDANFNSLINPAIDTV